MSMFSHRKVGVLALQGDYSCHERQIRVLGAEAVLVRLPKDLERVDSLIIPGGESTTMDILLDRFELREPIREFARSKPTYGTCAGMILLATQIQDNVSGVKPFGLMDIDVLRNGYGRQVFSFEETVTALIHGQEQRITATFIRAPRITRLGEGVEVQALYGQDPVLVRQNNLLASAFHNELEEQTTILEYFLTDFS